MGKGYSAEQRADLMTRICARISKGESLTKICKEKGVPDFSTIMRWLADSDELRDQYAGAREASADFYADEIVEIADTEADPNRARVRIDARKWCAAKLKPKKYGDRTTLDTDPDRPLQVVTTIRLIAQHGSRDQTPS